MGTFGARRQAGPRGQAALGGWLIVRIASAFLGEGESLARTQGAPVSLNATRIQGCRQDRTWLRSATLASKAPACCLAGVVSRLLLHSSQGVTGAPWRYWLPGTKGPCLAVAKKRSCGDRRRPPRGGDHLGPCSVTWCLSQVCVSLWCRCESPSQARLTLEASGSWWAWLSFLEGNSSMGLGSF